jgi:hypothetical protein
MLKELKLNDGHKTGIISDIKSVIENKLNTDDYVYEFIYSKLQYICSSDVDYIRSMLEDNRR